MAKAAKDARQKEWFVVWPHPEGEAHESRRFDSDRAAATWFFREACPQGAIRMYPALGGEG